MSGNKDWTGNSRSAHITIGAHNFTEEAREVNDYYATEPFAMHLLTDEVSFAPNIWECACGEGHLSKELEKAGYNVISTDLVDRGFGGVADFLTTDSLPIPNCDIITNPPYSKASEFVEHAMELLEDEHYLAMFLKLQFLEGKARKELFKRYPPKVIYVSASRLHCAMNGDFERYKNSNAVSYCWYLWQKGFHGDPIIKWIN